MTESTQGAALNFPKQLLVGAQMLFVAFGALVLVPILTGLDPNVALFTAGLGTLIFQFVTKRRVPVFLASSFAFIAPIIVGVQNFGIPATMSGLIAAGVVYILLSLLIRIRGEGIVKKLFPPVVVGPVIMVIGLNLAPVAINLALGKTGDGAAELVPYGKAILIAAVSLGVTVLVSLKGSGMLRLISILVGIAAGYILAAIMGLVDFTAVGDAALIATPNFVMPEFSWAAILFMLPVAIAPAIEHIGDILAIGNATGKDYLKEPGLKNTLLGDGLATSAAGLLGGPPNTTYSEVTGAVTLTRVFNPAVMTWAAILAVILSFSGTLGALLGSIPTPVMGGILVLLFGSIAAIGVGTLVRANVDLSAARNLILVSIVLVFGIGGMSIGVGDFKLAGIGLAGVAAVVLNLILPAATVQE